jgi:hypothetical protein
MEDLYIAFPHGLLSSGFVHRNRFAMSRPAAVL